MKTLFLRRFSGGRLARIVGVTAAAITWGAVALSSMVSQSKEAQATIDSTQPESPRTTASSTELASFPDEPLGGLVILRGIPVDTPPPQPTTVIKRVVVQSAPQVAPAPPTQSSSGS